jgi:hypothetical protein
MTCGAATTAFTFVIELSTWVHFITATQSALPLYTQTGLKSGVLGPIGMNVDEIRQQIGIAPISSGIWHYIDTHIMCVMIKRKVFMAHM